MNAKNKNIKILHSFDRINTAYRILITGFSPSLFCPVATDEV